jgi:hypothetical protein
MMKVLSKAQNLKKTLNSILPSNNKRGSKPNSKDNDKNVNKPSKWQLSHSKQFI